MHMCVCARFLFLFFYFFFCLCLFCDFSCLALCLDHCCRCRCRLACRINALTHMWLDQFPQATDCCHICFFHVCFVRLHQNLLKFFNACASNNTLVCSCCQHQFGVDRTAVNGAQEKLELCCCPQTYMYISI